ncbi:hypothetical protein [Streptomyces sp. AgN23]|uniref:ABC transporter permease subunit n=1 Tax=Streptomyces sp. AgN23 TaxID=1188315 RepID=UPI001B329BF2|nr:hypothetical protein [Streptomyces sp. AgN23]QTI87272.1 hypothetical protein AS97_39990 [Streptomyces sp. AgN23]
MTTPARPPATAPARPATVSRIAGLFVPLAVVVTAAALLGDAGGDLTTRVATGGLINLILVLSLYAYSGTSGVLSFGQIGFVLLGAYAGGILAMPPATRAVLLPALPSALAHITVPQPLLPVAAAALAALAALFTAPLMTRLNGIVGSIGTFSLMVIAHEVAANLRATNGAAGVSGVPATGGPVTPLLWALVALAATAALRHSRTGLRLRASQDHLPAAGSVGIDVRRARLGAWTLSAALAGAGGALYAQFVGSFTPDSLYLATTTLTIAMLVVGGVRGVTGAVAGTLVVTAVYQLLQSAEAGFPLGGLTVPAVDGVAQIGLSLLLLVVLLRRPGGITGGREAELTRAGVRRALAAFPRRTRSRS